MHSNIINKLEADLKPVLAEIEERGLIMDTGKMREIISGMEQRRDYAESKVYELFGVSEKINLNSSAELSRLITALNMQVLGHTTLSVNQKHYTGMLIEQQKKAINSIPSIG